MEDGYLAELEVPPSRTSWNKKNPTQEVPCSVRDEYQVRTSGLLSFLCGVSVRCRNARSSKARGLLQSVVAVCVTEDQLVRLALHAPQDEILAMCDRRGDDAVCLAEWVLKAFNGLGDLTPDSLGHDF